MTEGRAQLLTELCGVHVMVVTDADSAEVAEGLAAVGLADAAEAGAATTLIDRFGRPEGDRTLRRNSPR